MGKHDTNSLEGYSGYKYRLIGQVFCETLLFCMYLCVWDQKFLLLYFSGTFGWMGVCLSLSILWVLRLAFRHLGSSGLQQGLGLSRGEADGQGLGSRGLWILEVWLDSQTMSCWEGLCHKGSGLFRYWCRAGFGGTFSGILWIRHSFLSSWSVELAMSKLKYHTHRGEGYKY